MKRWTNIITDSHINRSNDRNNRFGFFRTLRRKLGWTTALVGGAIAGILLADSAVAIDDDNHQKVEHVLLISVDGMHQSDLAWYVQTHPQSALAALTAQGIDFSNASTPYPSDSFPGMVGQLTGGNPSSTGIYYDDTWNHAVYPAGTTTFTGHVPGGEVNYTEGLDKNKGALDAGQGIVPLPALIHGQTFCR